MKKRSWFVWLVGVALILSPVYYYAEAVYLSGSAWTDAGAAIGWIPLPKLVGIFLAPLTGALVLRVRPISWYAIVGYAAYTVAANTALLAVGRMQVATYALNLPTALLVIGYFIRREVRAPYFNPRLRWWESDRIDLHVKAEVKGDDAFAGETVNISPTGVFIASDKAIPVGKTFELTLDLPSGSVTARAEAVWVSEGKNRPRGFGARFDAPSSGNIKAALRDLHPRAAPRVPLELTAEIAGKASITCKTFDISPIGCFLATDAAFSPGEKLDLTLHIGDEPIAVAGVVVWVSDGSSETPKGIGIKFARRSEKLAAQLSEIRETSAP